MKETKNVTIESSVGSLVMGLLGVAFVVLKLCGIINWSWWWVTAPFWGPIALVLSVSLIILIGVSIRYLSKK